jgi:hypothetical protein
MNLTSAQCDAFRINPAINPKTGRDIKINGPTYNKLLKYCSSEKIAQKVHKSPKKFTKNIEKSPPKNICINVIGLGCSLMKNDELLKYEKHFAWTINMNSLIMCNKKLGNTLSTIVKTVCFLKPSLKSTFVLNVYNETKKYIENGYTVFLIGHMVDLWLQEWLSYFL